MLDYSKFRCEWLDKSELWKIVDDFSAIYWPIENQIWPVDVEKIIEKNLGLNIIAEKGLKSDYDIDAFLRNDFTGITIDEDYYMEEKYQNRSRFSLAHELGHFVLHKDIYLGLPFSYPKEWKEFSKQISKTAYGKLEWQANEFAGNLLVPNRQLKEEILKAIEDDEEFSSEIIDIALNGDKITLTNIVSWRYSNRLSRFFSVSETVIRIRVQRYILEMDNLFC